MRSTAEALKLMWRWTGDHALATSVMFTATAFCTLVAVRESPDWFIASLTIGSGLCWIGVLLPARVRETAAVLAGGLAAICGALVSIIFSHSLETPGQTDSSFTPLFLGLLAAGSASVYGQHLNAVAQREAARALTVMLVELSRRQDAEAGSVPDAVAAMRANLDAALEETRTLLLEVRRRRRRGWRW